ncbi:MAG: hypothetical protein JNL32_01370 [Candidatus Kapabacteria bacterium]|nr:hypothetical protein [Candidatus Kapabacteria bacterium]
MNPARILFATFIVALLLPSVLIAQPRFSVSRIDTSQYPRLSASFYLFDANRNQVQSVLGDLTVQEGGKNRQVLSITCPQVVPARPPSAALSIDISGSMNTQVGSGNIRSVELAKRSADEFARILPTPPSELALQICDTKATLLQDFTTDALKIRGQIPFIQAGGGNDFKTHLLNPLTGLLNVAKNGRNSRVAILFTDALWNPLSKEELQACIDSCTKHNIRFFAVLFSSTSTSPNGIKVSFQALAEATGGAMIDGITEPGAVSNLVQDLISVTQGGKPCTIEWLTESSCADGPAGASALITSLPTGAQQTVTYAVPQYKKATLAAVNKTVLFGGVPPLTSRDTIVEFVALNSDITVSEARIANPLFTLPDGFTLRTVKQGETLRIRIRFTAADSVNTVAELQLTSDACTTESVFIGAGYPGASYNTGLQLVKPNGGELFMPKRDTVIQWTGVFPEDTVMIEYSTDAGASWTFLTYANGLRWRWNVPFTPSESCLVRVSTAIISSAERLMNNDWVIMDMKYSRSGNYIVASGSGTRSRGQTGLAWIIDRTTKTKTEIEIPYLFGYGIDITPDESAIVVAGQDTVYCFSVAGTLLWKRDIRSVRSIHISPDGREVLANEFVLSITDGLTVRTMNASQSGKSVLSVKGTYALLSRFGFTLCRYSDGQSLFQINRVSNSGIQYTALCISNDERKFAIALNDSIVGIYSTADGKELVSFRSDRINHSISFSRNDSMLIIGNEDRTVRFWSVTDGSYIGQLLDTIPGFGLVATHPDGVRIAGATGSIYTQAALTNNNHNIVEWDASKIAIGAQSNSRTRAWYPGVTIDTKRPVLQSILSRDGQRVIVVEERPDADAIPANSNPRRATMYNAATGAPLFTLDTALNLRSVAMSWNGNYIAAVFFSADPDSNNHYAVIYDARTGKELENTLLDMPGTSVCFHPGDSAIAIGQGNGELLLRPIYFRSKATGIDIQLSVLQPVPEVEVLGCQFNPEGNSIVYLLAYDPILMPLGATCYRDSVYPLYSGTTFRPLISRPRSTQLTRFRKCLSWDLGTDWMMFVSVGIDSTNGRSIARNANFYGIEYSRLIRYNRNSTMLLHSEDTLSANAKNGAGKWGRAVLYDVTSRLPFSTLHGKHRGLITDASFSMNNDVIATGGFELQSSGDTSGRVIIWQRSPAAFDISDSLFTILGPRARMREIDMGTVRVGGLRDSVVTQLVCNTGRLPVVIDSIVIQASANAGFSVIGGAPVTIDTNICALIELRFQPTVAGSYTGTILAYTNAGLLQTRIIGNATEQLFRIPDAVIDLGKVEVGSQKDSLVVSLFKNTSALRRASLRSLRCVFPDSTQFMVVAPATASVSSGDSLDVTLRFAPQSLGRASTFLQIDAEYDSPQTTIEPIRVQLFGEGVCAASQASGGNPYRIGFDTPNIPATTGQNLNLVLRVIPPQGATFNALPAEATVTFLMPLTTLYPIAPATTTDITNGMRTVELRTSRSGDTLAMIPLTTMLGNSDTATVAIQNVDFGGSCRPLLALDSTVVRFTDICQAGGAPRLIGSAPVTALMITPNPVGSTPALRYTIAEATAVRIEISDLLGNTVQRIDIPEQARGLYAMPLDVAQLAGGVYHATLVTRSERKTIVFTKW